MTGRTTLALVAATLMGVTAVTFALWRARAAARPRDDDRWTDAQAVDLAGEMSFPASDPPSWTGVQAGG